MAKYSNSAEAQRFRLLAYLKKYRKLTSIEAQAKLDILRAPARVFELRERGENIETHWREDTTPEGNPHRVAEYILMPGKRKTPGATGAKSKSRNNDTGVHREGKA